MLNIDTFMKQVRSRINSFKKSEQIRLPLCDFDSVVDFGRYSAVILDSKTWQKLQRIIIDNPESDSQPSKNDYDIHKATSLARSFIAEHVVHSIQDIEELLSIAEQLRIKNGILELRLRSLLQEKVIH
ncbi:MAG: hypothetical protein K8S56_09965 [Candidatus Cloacimonetes bacterium]|nr:hypothetical protein [Candidatus Cloacimonadota bacterium]